MESISVVIPCKNEALNLPLILPYLDPAVTEVVLVDPRQARTRQFLARVIDAGRL